MSCDSGFPSTYEQWTAIHEAGHACVEKALKQKVDWVWIVHNVQPTDNFEHGHTNSTGPGLANPDVMYIRTAAGIAAEILLNRPPTAAFLGKDIEVLQRLLERVNSKETPYQQIDKAKAFILDNDLLDCIESLALKVLREAPMSVAHANNLKGGKEISAAATSVHLLLNPQL